MRPRGRARPDQGAGGRKVGGEGAAGKQRCGEVENALPPPTTRRSTSSSSPSYQTWRLLFASNSRWLSKSTFTCSRCATLPAVRTEYCGVGVIVGNPELHPESA